MTEHTHDQPQPTDPNLDPAAEMDLDARITAYALGELDDAEARDVEMFLARDPEAAESVAALQSLTQQLTHELKLESGGVEAPALTDAQRDDIEWGGNASPPFAVTIRRWALIATGTAVAASIALAGILPFIGEARSEDASMASSGGASVESFLDAAKEESDTVSSPAEAKPGSDFGVPLSRRPVQPNPTAPPPPTAGRTRAAGGLGGGGGGDGRDHMTLYSASAVVEDELAGFPGLILEGDEAELGQELNRNGYDAIVENPFIDPTLGTESNLSTFSIDVDTASYANVRSILSRGALPPAGAVRIEEMVNYFSYDYQAPSPGDVHPFAMHVDSMAAPWKQDHRLVRIGVQGKNIEFEERPATNLVFLLDVSGSMNSPNKLPLVKESMKMMVDQLDSDDRISIAVYAGASGVALPPTFCDDKATINRAIDALRPGGSTAGAEGIQLAYDLAVENFIEGGVNRVILATDGDFNVGISSDDELVRLIEAKRELGVFLTVLGVGTGNFQDAKMENLSNAGNGNFAYIDTLREARKVLVDQIGGTLITIAKDVKIQVDFNPAQVQAYRLIGYENRILRAQDFNDDKKDAGEIGAGHSVTALYEVVPHGVDFNLPDIDESKYAARQRPRVANAENEDSSGDADKSADDSNNDDDAAADVDGDGISKEMLTVRLRYKAPDGDASTRVDQSFIDDPLDLDGPTPDMAFVAAVAEFGMLLRNSAYKGNADPQHIFELAERGMENDPRGDRAEFLELVRRMANLTDRE